MQQSAKEDARTTWKETVFANLFATMLTVSMILEIAEYVQKVVKSLVSEMEFVMIAATCTLVTLITEIVMLNTDVLLTVLNS